ncbi:hypothetical protein [Burkholderia cenocepacia]|uniref:hypothetical protein n=1 Tax=Burkholderia cenocepacia TaxID=95486 RepID=UPI001B9F53F8|nr:hypothetical protein [Burkholderia cenocepacia]MBR7969076.1 hypothetical protein [Burkholderia cenocepacia]
MMSKGEKSKRARARADRLFRDVNNTVAAREIEPVVRVDSNDTTESGYRSTHLSNPFGNDFADRIELDEDVAARIFTIPRGLAIPSGYESAEDVREAMRRAWGVEWGNFEANTVDILLPPGWTVQGSKEGRFQLHGEYGVRATWDRSADPKVSLLTRYFIDQKFDSKDNHCQLVVLDRQYELRRRHWSYWYPQSGKNHPQWDEMHNWLAEYCPGYEDPLRHWEDCEENNDRWLEQN